MIKKEELKPVKPLEWLKDKVNINKGTSYYEPKISLRQCAAWMSEYCKIYFDEKKS